MCQYYFVTNEKKPHVVAINISMVWYDRVTVRYGMYGIVWCGMLWDGVA